MSLIISGPFIRFNRHKFDVVDAVEYSLYDSTTNKHVLFTIDADPRDNPDFQNMYWFYLQAAKSQLALSSSTSEYDDHGNGD